MENEKKFFEELFMMKLHFHNEKMFGKILNKTSELSENARQEGNALYKSKHNMQVHESILLHYTKSIAFAPKSSEKLALGYSNRSALLVHLQRYKECIIDIDRALKITKSEELKSKLIDRKERCMALLEKSKVKEDTLFKPFKSLKLSDQQTVGTVFEIPNIVNSAENLRVSKSVDLKYNETYGRHYVANKDIKPGDIIIAEKSYACYADFEKIYLICSHCLAYAWNGLPCDCCAFAIYCSESCKTAAWEEYHDIECSILPYMYSDTHMYGESASFAIRIFIKAVKAEGLQNVMREAQSTSNDDNGINIFLSNMSSGQSKFGHCYNLQSTPIKRKWIYEHWFHEVMIIYLLIMHTNIIYGDNEKPDLTSTDANISLLRKLFMKLGSISNFNQFLYHFGCTCPKIMCGCENDCDEPIGRFIAPYCSLINHSCVPNVAILCLPQQKIVLYATQPIKKNEQVFHSYGPILDGEEIVDRKIFFRDNYYFTCQCPACKENWIHSRDFNLSHADVILYTKLQLEFKQILHNAKDFSRNQFFSHLGNDWQLIDEASLSQAFKLSELIYRYFNKQTAFHVNGRFRRYIRRAVHILYAEKFDMPKGC